MLQKIEFYNSDRFRQTDLPGGFETVQHKIGPFPAVPPAKVRFEIVNPEITLVGKPYDAQRLMRARAATACSVYFGEMMWILPDGKLTQSVPIWTQYMHRNQKPLTLRIECDDYDTLANAQRLPAMRPRQGERVLLSKGSFPLAPFKICLHHPNNLIWHDHIMIDERSSRFIIQSVYLKHAETRK